MIIMHQQRGECVCVGWVGGISRYFRPIPFQKTDPCLFSIFIAGCIVHNITVCRSTGNCRTIIPHVFNLYDNLSKMMNIFNFIKTFSCHYLSEEFFCNLLLSPPCTASTTSTSGTFDIRKTGTFVSLPCNSLCNEMEGCLTDAEGWTSLCDNFPESASSEVCFASNTTKGNATQCLSPVA